MCGVCVRHFSHSYVFATLRPVACQAPLSRNSPGKNTGVGYMNQHQTLAPMEMGKRIYMIPPILYESLHFAKFFGFELCSLATHS